MLIKTRLRRILLAAFVPFLLVVGKIITDRPYFKYDDDFFVFIFFVYIGTYFFLELLFFALSENIKVGKGFLLY
jgi:hypothetical protein